MKIYLSKYWRYCGLFFISIIVFLIVGTICFCIWSHNREDYIMVLLVSGAVLILVDILLCSKRLFTYAIVEKNEIQSYSIFTKKLCTITTKKPVYYAVFVTPQGMRCAKFIALSNEPFEYQPTYGFSKVRFIQHYNMAKQIVMPYNEQTTSILNLDTWHKIN